MGLDGLASNLAWEPKWARECLDGEDQRSMAYPAGAAQQPELKCQPYRLAGFWLEIGRAHV